MTLKQSVLAYKFEIIVFLLVVFGIGIRMYRLEIPDSYYFDEVYFAYTAEEMAKGNKYAWESTAEAPEGFAYEWTHPPLGKEISAIGILIFGDNTFGWRFFQALFGGLGVWLIYLLGKNLFASKSAGLLSALLYGLDGFFFVLSRITMVDIFMADFLLLASLFVVKYARRRKNIHLVLAGLFCGASVSIKWSGVYILEFLAGVSLFMIYYFEVYKSSEKGKSFIISLIKIIPRMFLAFVLIPILVYIVTYIPFFYHGNSLLDFFYLQENMYIYHRGVTETHMYQSAWWQWPILMRPIYMHFEDLGNGLRANIYLLGNPFIWWTGLLFFILGIIQVIRKEIPALVFAVVSVFAYWLPWALSPRKITFIYHFMPSFLFILLISGYFLNLLWLKSNKGKLIVGLYVLVAAGVFVYFYPILAAVPLKSENVEGYFWLSTWR